MRLSVCICTYKRAELLSLLLSDLLSQTVQPVTVIIVDGDPESGEVSGILGRVWLPGGWAITYIPSNHANLAYQRYLGWRAASGHDWLLYLDDDLRLHKTTALECVLAPLNWSGRDVIAVTAETELPARGPAQSGKTTGLIAWLVRRYGGARRIPPGGLAPSGYRRAPVNSGRPYERVEWLSGRVIGLKMRAVDKQCFSDSLFAVTHVRCGLGEDTFLGRRLCSKGEMVLAFNAGIEHPDADSPKSYPADAYGFGRALAYSRRLLNDHYRGLGPPRVGDRVALAKSYAGNTAIAWSRALMSLGGDDWRFAWGYARGVVLGLTRKPTARNLTPRIDWWGDAEKALERAVVVAAGVV